MSKYRSTNPEEWLPALVTLIEDRPDLSEIGFGRFVSELTA